MNPQSMFWFIQWAGAQSRKGGRPMTQEECIVTGAVLLVLIAMLAGFCIWMWWDSRPTNIFAEYRKMTDRNPKPKAEAETHEDKPASQSVSGALGTAAIAMRALNLTGEKNKGGLM